MSFYLYILCIVVYTSTSIIIVNDARNIYKVIFRGNNYVQKFQILNITKLGRCYNVVCIRRYGGLAAYSLSNLLLTAVGNI